MAEMHEAQRSTCPEATQISLRGFYLIGEMATMIGIAIVFVLNLATPLSFVLDSLGSLSQMDAVELGLKAGIRLIFIILVTFFPLFTAMHCLSSLSQLTWAFGSWPRP
jgi:fumarate reductase subunit D